MSGEKAKCCLLSSSELRFRGIGLVVVFCFDAFCVLVLLSSNCDLGLSSLQELLPSCRTFTGGKKLIGNKHLALTIKDPFSLHIISVLAFYISGIF